MSDLPGPEPSGSRSPTLPWGAAIVAGALLAISAGLIYWAIGSAPEREPLVRRGPAKDDFVGVRACRECHPGEYAAHSGSGHARTLRPAGAIELARWLDGRREADPERPEVHWDYAVEGGRLSATRVEAGEARRYALDYALGSGKHAVTFVSWDGDRRGTRGGGLEHRLTYFEHARAMGITPGQGEGNPEPGLSPEGFHVPPAVMLDCLSCHATRTSLAGPRVVDPDTLIPNVSCERCHGPSRAHVEAARRSAPAAELAMPFGGGRGDPTGEVRMCGRCHRLPEMVPPDSIRPESTMLVRFPSVGLVQSACYAKSGRMACTTCHDPHARTSGDAKGYDRACLDCHAEVKVRACGVNPREGCVGCHMPKRDVGHGLRFTDHWVRKRSGE